MLVTMCSKWNDKKNDNRNMMLTEKIWHQNIVLVAGKWNKIMRTEKMVLKEKNVAPKYLGMTKKRTKKNEYPRNNLTRKPSRGKIVFFSLKLTPSHAKLTENVS